MNVFTKYHSQVLKYLRRHAARASTSKQHRHISLVLCLLTCFSGGVFLATCFLHLSPELKESIEQFQKDQHVRYTFSPKMK
ncbi:MAG: ZIP family metal transporter [Lutibacter sp.]|nr:ZIP family metal transporter [Lutibacter sp.]